MFWIAKKMSDLINLSKGESNTEIKSKSSAEKIESENQVTASDNEAQNQNIRDEKSISAKSKVSTRELFLDQETIDEYEKWCQQLSILISKIDLESQIIHSERGEYINLKTAKDTTIGLSKVVFDTLGQLAAQFNDTSIRSSGKNRVRLATTKHTINNTESETNSKAKNNQHNAALTEFRISSATRSLSVTTEPGRLYAYLLPANVNLDIRSHETLDRLKLGIMLDTTDGDKSWNVNGLAVSNKEISYLCKVLIRDLVILSCLDNLAYESGKKFEHVENIQRVGISRGHKDALSLTTEISSDLFKDLVIAQQNTVQKLLRQQEEIQASIARDLHDTVLADIMMLERRTTSSGKINKKSLLKTLEEISVTIREICQGLVPRDLKDWGLETVLEDLVDKTAERITADCSFSVEGNLPELPSAVELHIFRIVQEALNNIEKYSQADKVKVHLIYEEGLLKVTISDTGIGFDIDNPEENTGGGGFGLPSINERIEIIRAYYPAKLKFESKKNEGTTIGLEVTVDAFD